MYACAKGYVYKPLGLSVEVCPPARLAVKMSFFHEKMLKFRADMSPVISLLVNGDLPPGLTENQKRTLRRQGNKHMIKGRCLMYR